MLLDSIRELVTWAHFKNLNVKTERKNILSNINVNFNFGDNILKSFLTWSWTKRQTNVLSGIFPLIGAQFLPLSTLLKIDDVGFINLQYGDISKDIKESGFKEKIINISDLDLYNEIDDVIALIECLDLVVTTPNVNVHFAGAIGKSCMVLSPLYNEVFMYSDLNDGKCEWYKNQKTMVIENNLDSTLLKMKNLINSL